MGSGAFLDALGGEKCLTPPGIGTRLLCSVTVSTGDDSCNDNLLFTAVVCMNQETEIEHLEPPELPFYSR